MAIATIAGVDLGKSAEQFHARAKQQVEEFNDCVRIYEARLQSDHLIIGLDLDLLQLPIWFRASQMYAHCYCCCYCMRTLLTLVYLCCCCCCMYVCGTTAVSVYFTGARMIGTGSLWLDGVDWP